MSPTGHGPTCTVRDSGPAQVQTPSTEFNYLCPVLDRARRGADLDQPASVTVQLREYGRSRFGNAPSLNQLEVVVAEVAVLPRLIVPNTGVLVATPDPASVTEI